MKMLAKTITIAAIALGLTSGAALAVDMTQRGMLPFATWDMNNDGSISSKEFTSIRSKRQAARAAEGRFMRNQATSPSFASFDTDGNGLISASEFNTRQTALLPSRPGAQRMGMARNMGNRNWGNRGNRGWGNRGWGNRNGPGRGMGRRWAQ